MRHDPRWNPGYEYRTVGQCPKTGRPYLSPKAWNTTRWGPPIHVSCACCGSSGGRLK